MVMSFQLSFARSFVYDTSKEGITVPIALKLISREVSLEAKIDTGAGCCIFARQYAEAIGIDVETGLPQKISTATGTFITYGHDVTLSVLDYEFDSTVYFAQDLAFHRNVLGRTGWL